MTEEKAQLKRNIQEWLDLGNQCTQISNQLSDLKKERNEYENRILNTIVDLNLNEKTLLVNDCHLKMKQSKSFQAITPDKN